MATSSIFKAGNTAFITGGASGIGLALAKKCHSYGMRVAIADINKEHLELASQNVSGIKTFALDVAKLDEWQSVRDSLLKEFGRIDLLALNAGMSIRDISWSDANYFRTILETNLFGVINGITTLLPSIQNNASATHPASIVFTGSKQGITNPPGNPAYNASKAAVKNLAEGLSWELRNKPIGVHLLVPGWTFTGLSGSKPGSNEGKPAGAWTPEQVVDFAEQKINEGQFWIMCPDNDVSEDLDKKRMLWAAGDIVEGRPPLSRWREDWKDRAAEGVKNILL